MDHDAGGSVTLWIGDLKGGDPRAAQKLWERYFATLVGLARARLRDARRAAADEEDVVLSAFDSFFAQASSGRFPRLDDREDLWKVLVTITRRKVADQLEREGAQKRGGGRLADEAALAGPGRDGMGLDGFAGAEPSPEFAAMVADECRRRLEGLADDTLRSIALLRMEGYTNEEVAAKLGIGLRSVVRKLDLIRKSWERDQDRS
ncbi:RNA polymerase sigma factor [Aquisphaera giovannonii]|uniref:RNA polymerase sigma factor n=1 Tax=Aquisphaera giovannonii TaxID=406548 RepID=A0A5B9VXY4_9BACT|nr:ECF-type sigma factor [Aquisphaera giovannonii]QEH33203.1 RNA polymerase sigma factor [Aquisphaera giovannonii]